jgi:hypothetical protein
MWPHFIKVFSESFCENPTLYVLSQQFSPKHII